MRVANVIKVFTCDVAELLDYFADEMYEPWWGVEEDERRQQLLQSLEQPLRSENSSLALSEVHVPEIELLDELPATAGWRERLEQASADQRAVIDLCLAHVALPEPDAPDLLALHGARAAATCSRSTSSWTRRATPTTRACRPPDSCARDRSGGRKQAVQPRGKRALVLPSMNDKYEGCLLFVNVMYRLNLSPI